MTYSKEKLINNKFENLKSDFLLKKVFNTSSVKIALEFLKYNKKTQKRINFSLNNYKEYSGKYSSIKMELKLVENIFGKFINIKKGEESYYHIYFNDSEEEIKRTFIKENEKVNSINIIIDYQIESFDNLFYNCKCIKSINFKKFARNNIKNMSYVFYGCSSLEEIKFSNFITSNVENMSFMFFECSSLKKLNLSNFDTSNVKNMCNMFGACSSLKELNLFNFDIKKVNNISSMFYKCSSLNKLNRSNFLTDNITYMNEMFRECSLLK